MSAVIATTLRIRLHQPTCWQLHDDPFEAEAGEGGDGLGLGGREEEGLAGFGEVEEEGGESAGEAHVEDTVGFIKDLR